MKTKGELNNQIDVLVWVHQHSASSVLSGSYWVSCECNWIEFQTVSHHVRGIFSHRKMYLYCFFLMRLKCQTWHFNSSLITSTIFSLITCPWMQPNLLQSVMGEKKRIIFSALVDFHRTPTVRCSWKNTKSKHITLVQIKTMQKNINMNKHL